MSSFWADLLTGAGLVLAAIAAVSAVLGARLTKRLSDAKEKASNERVAKLENETALAKKEAAESKERTKLVEMALERQKEETAKAQLELKFAAEPRWWKFDSDAFKNSLKKVAPVRVELLFPKGDSETYMFLNRIAANMHEVGWTANLRELAESDLVAGMPEEFTKDAPLTLRAGAVAWQIVFVGKNVPLIEEPGVPDFSHPVYSILFALGFGKGGGTKPGVFNSFHTYRDPRMADGLIKVIMPPKSTDW